MIIVYQCVAGRRLIKSIFNQRLSILNEDRRHLSNIDFKINGKIYIDSMLYKITLASTLINVYSTMIITVDQRLQIYKNETFESYFITIYHRYNINVDQRLGQIIQKLIFFIWPTGLKSESTFDQR